MGGIEGGEAGLGGGFGALEGISPGRDGAIGFQRGEGRAGSRNADEVAAAGEWVIADARVAPGGDGAIGAHRREGVGVGIDGGVTVVGGQGGQQAAISAVAPSGDRTIGLQRRESAAIRGDGDIAGAGWRTDAAFIAGAPGEQAAIGLHGHHGLAVGEDLRVTGSCGFAGAAG